MNLVVSPLMHKKVAIDTMVSQDNVLTGKNKVAQTISPMISQPDMTHCHRLAEFTVSNITEIKCISLLTTIYCVLACRSSLCRVILFCSCVQSLHTDIYICLQVEKQDIFLQTAE